MISVIPFRLVILFGFFGLFLFYQSQHHSSGSVPSGNPEYVIGISIMSGALCNIIFLLYLGYRTVWWSPLLILVLFVPFLFIGVILERIIGRVWLAVLGFVGWPICAYFMFANVP